MRVQTTVKSQKKNSGPDEALARRLSVKTVKATKSWNKKDHSMTTVHNCAILIPKLKLYHNIGTMKRRIVSTYIGSSS